MSKLSNPAIAAMAVTPAGQKAVDKSIDIAALVVKILLVSGTAYFIYNQITNKFDKWGLNPNYPPSNISDAQAAAKAEAIYTAMYGAGNGFSVVKQQIFGVNYNGFTKIYNAFGIRKAFDNIMFVHKSEGTLIEWFNNQFDAAELAELRFVVSGIFKQ